MNWLDIAITFTITVPTYFGYRKGFLRKLLGIAGIIVGFILAVKFYTPVSGMLQKVIKENPVFVNVVSFLLIIAFVYGASVWIAKYIANINSGTSLIDKILGTAAGFAQGLIISSVILYNLAFAGIPSQQTKESSMLYSTIYKISPVIFNKVLVIFPGLHELYNEYINFKKPGSEEPFKTQPQQKQNKK